MEEKALYTATADATERVVIQSFTIYLLQVAMISDLVARGIGKNASEVVRLAIEAFYKAQEAK